jgi:hypothetical protein
MMAMEPLSLSSPSGSILAVSVNGDWLCKGALFDRQTVAFSPFAQ